MNIEAIKRRLLVKYSDFGSILAGSKLIEELSIKTAGTDGDNIYYNPNFMSSLTEEEQVFILAHEVYHIAFNHVFRSEGKDKKLWNIAADAVANANIKKDGLPIVKGGVDIEEAINYDVEEMYEKLLEERKRQQGGNEFSKDEKADANNDVGHDTHSMWKKAIENRNQKSQSKSKESLSNKLRKVFNNNGKKEEEVLQQSKHQQDLEKAKRDTIKKMLELGEKKAFEQNRIERKRKLEELRKSLVSKSHGQGDDTNSEIRQITDIGISRPLIDWRILLKEAIKYDVDWTYQNASIEEGVLTAYLEELPRPETEIVLDTSGSIDENLLRNFLRECKNILQNSNVKVGCFDTKFYGFTEIKDVSDIDNLSFYGGGGTDFEVAVNAFTRRVENKIIFTDGYANMPSTRMDAIWIVFGEKNIKPLGGKVILLDSEQFEKLCNYEINCEPKGKAR